MRNNWLFSIDPDGSSPHILPIKPFLGAHLFSQFSLFVENSLHQFRLLHLPGSMAQDAFSSMSQLAAAAIFWFASASSSSLSQQISGNKHLPRTGICKPPMQVKHTNATTDSLTGFHFGANFKGEFPFPDGFRNISSFMVRLLCREAERLQSLPVFSLAAAVVPPFANLSSKVLAASLENAEVQLLGSMDQRPCQVGHHGCSDLSVPDLNWTRHTVEPRTGIEFPMILDKLFGGNSRCALASEVLVGTGSRTMKIIRIKTLEVYAFGFYVHPKSVCEKLGAKYASIPVGELNYRRDFYEDLLREDIDMTVRLVINCNGVKINTVKDAFEKALRARLQKTNPDTDYHCLKAFGLFFTNDIPLPVGTTVDFRQTADGQLITEIEGNRIGAVKSKDLCRAFFDMYIGDIPVSEQTKEEIGKNVANIIRKC